MAASPTGPAVVWLRAGGKGHWGTGLPHLRAMDAGAAFGRANVARTTSAGSWHRKPEISHQGQ